MTICDMPDVSTPPDAGSVVTRMTLVSHSSEFPDKQRTSSRRWAADDIAHRLGTAGQKMTHVVDDDGHDVLLILGDVSADMRRYDHVGHVPQGTRGRQGPRCEHVQRGAGDAFPPQAIDQGCLVNGLAASEIDEEGAWLHGGEDLAGE